MIECDCFTVSFFICFILFVLSVLKQATYQAFLNSLQVILCLILLTTTQVPCWWHSCVFMFVFMLVLRILRSWHLGHLFGQSPWVSQLEEWPQLWMRSPKSCFLLHWLFCFNQLTDVSVLFVWFCICFWPLAKVEQLGLPILFGVSLNEKKPFTLLTTER